MGADCDVCVAIDKLRRNNCKMFPWMRGIAELIEGFMTSHRRNITQPEDWWAAFEKQANAEGMTLSEWVGWACKAKLPRGIGIHAGLSDRPPANRPRKPKDEGR
jgi:hypothetical protein